MKDPLTKQQTIQDRIYQMRDDLIALANCCNQDGQPKEASKLQDMLVTLREVNIQCADVAAWPPKINFTDDGISVWECV